MQSRKTRGSARLLGHAVVSMPDDDMRAGSVTAAGFVGGVAVAIAY